MEPRNSNSTMLSDAESEPFLHDGAIEPSTEKPQHAARHTKPTQRRWAFPTPILTHILVFALTSIVWAAVLLHSRRSQAPRAFGGIHHQLAAATWRGCGASPAEAKALGCQYDILSNHWVPGGCADPESIADYQSDGSWFAYRHENRTGSALAVEAMGDLPVYYTSVRDHVVHCAALWRKQYRAFFEGRASVDNIIVDSAHTMHCAQYLIDMTDYGTDFWNMPISVEVGYAGCFALDK